MIGEPMQVAQRRVTPERGERGVFGKTFEAAFTFVLEADTTQ
jgi:hypothetical protein